jgi:hypothetical protein
MPRYFFNIEDGQQKLTRDEEGIDLPDLDAVREEATEAARQIMSQSVLVGDAIDGRKFVITDEGGIIVREFIFKDAIRPPR